MKETRSNKNNIILYNEMLGIQNGRNPVGWFDLTFLGTILTIKIYCNFVTL